MANANYTLLQKITVATATPSAITFSGIPQTGYQSLVLKMSARITGGSNPYEEIYHTFNGVSTSSQYLRQYVTSTGTGTGSGRDTTGGNTWSFTNGTTSTSNYFSNAEMIIPNYNSSNPKTIRSQVAPMQASNVSYSVLYSGVWDNTASITTWTLTTTAGTFLAGSEFALYGLSTVNQTPISAPKATGGDIVVNDGTYWYHAFLSSGVFTPSQNLSCDYLVIAGGGAGGGEVGYAGGGGAGGVRSTVGATGGGGSLESALSLIATPYTVVIGAGGTSASSGSNSTFSTITSIGGGCAGYYNQSAYLVGKTGGSGGGGGTNNGSTGGSGTANQGYAGGNGINGYGAGGGGAAGAGITGSGGGGMTVGGSAITLSTWASATSTGVSSAYAGGGGASVQGGTGYLGGGGGAGRSYSDMSTGQNATANTGSGGGGGGGLGHAGLGGSGIVIVRYTMA